MFTKLQYIVIYIRLSIKKILFPVQRVVKIEASRAATIFFFSTLFFFSIKILLIFGFFFFFFEK